MTGCVDPDCKETLKRRLECVEVFTFGEKPGEGIMGEISKVGDLAKDASEEAKKKVPKDWLGAFFFTFGIFIIVAIATGYHSVQSASITAKEALDRVQENTRDIHAIKESNAVQAERFAAICISLNEIKKDVKHLLRKEPRDE